MKKYLLPLIFLASFACAPDYVPNSKAKIAKAAAETLSSLGTIQASSCSTNVGGCSSVSDCLVTVKDVGVFLVHCNELDCSITTATSFDNLLEKE